MTDQAQLDKVTELTKNAHTCMLTAIDEQGELVSRPMALQEAEFDGDLWFFTGNDSDKLEDIEHNNQVNVSFLSGNSWVSIAGDAELVDDRAKAEELWSPMVKAYFPDGLDDPNLQLLKVHASGAEYWDSNNKVVSLFKMAKAAATDTTPDMGENKTVQY